MESLKLYTLNDLSMLMILDYNLGFNTILN